MSKPDLNKNGTPRKHGNTERQSFRLDCDVIAEARKLSDEINVPLSKLYRDMVTYALRDNLKDGSVNRTVQQRRSDVSAVKVDADIISFTQELQKMRNDLNQIGNNLNQDIRMRNLRMKQLTAEEQTTDDMKAQFESEKVRIDKKYEEDFEITVRTINGLKAKGLDTSRKMAEYQKLKSAYQAEVDSLKKKYTGRDFTAEKNQIVMLNENDEILRKQIEKSVADISDVMRNLSDVLRKAVSQ